MLGGVSLIGYGIVSLRLRLLSTSEDVWTFLGIFGGLFLIYGAACLAMKHAAARTTQILIWAALFRLLMIPAGLTNTETAAAAFLEDLRSEEIRYRPFVLYDNDVWRYLWDGHVLISGGDPYAATPAQLEALADEGVPWAEELFDPLFYEVFDRVSYRRFTTVYPPLALSAFAFSHAAAPASIAFWKVLVAGFDFGTCVLLVLLLRRLGRPPEWVLLYAWNPLALKEFAGSGHVDALLIFFLVLAAERLLAGAKTTSTLCFAAAILIKPTPILLLPLFLRRWFLPAGRLDLAGAKQLAILAGAGLIAYLPFFNSWTNIVQGVGAFARQWVFHPGLWGLWQRLEQRFGDGREIADGVTLFLTLALVAATTYFDDGSPRRFLLGIWAILGGYVLLSATMMPWYLLWALPFAAATRSVAWPTVCGFSMFSYLIFIDGVERSWVGPLCLIVFIALLRIDASSSPSPASGEGAGG